MFPFYSAGIHVQICGSNELNMHKNYDKEYECYCLCTTALLAGGKETKLINMN